jgi:AmmeMemoRadiSam system protein A
MPPSSETRPHSSALPEAQPEFNHEERVQLLQMAHDAILSILEERELQTSVSSSHLSELRGAFTTLYLNGKLRGCVGYPTAILPLYRTVIETAQAAAFDDPRFAPVSLDEAGELKVSLSVLSALRPIRAEEVEVGRHGLVISYAGHRGLLLPQVASEHGWDRVTFLEQTCRKAGLSENAWRQGVVIEGFAAEVFGDAGHEA